MIGLLNSLRFALVSAGQNFYRNLAVSLAAVFTMALILLVIIGIGLPLYWLNETRRENGAKKLFAAGEPDPVRIDLFGDTIESMRRFDPASQRSHESLTELVLRPVSEVPLDSASVSRFREGWRELFGPPAAQDPIYASVSDGRRHPGMEHWAPLFHPTMENLLDYLPDAAVSFDSLSDDVLAARDRFVLERLKESRRRQRTPS